MTNLTINWQNANIVNIPYTSFNESAVYYNQYSTNGAYNVTFLLQNPLSTFVASVLITIMNPIVNFRCSYVPANTWNGNMMSLKTFADSGDNVVLTLNPGDGSASTVNTINITSINQEYDFNYTYNTVGNYSSNIWACNQLGCQNCSNYVQIQYKIIKTDFQYITSGNIEYINTNLTTTLTFSGTNFPTALTAIFNFSDGSPPLSLLLTSGMMPYTLMKNLSKPGFGVSTVILQNLANSENFTASYEAFVKYINVSVTVLWGPKKLIGFGSFLNIFPLNNYLYLRPNSQMIGTIVNGTVTYYDSKSSSTVLLCNSTFINGELNFTISSMGNVNLSLTLYNPIDTITSSLPIIIGSSIQNTEITTSPSTLLPGYYGFIIVTWSIISATNCICVDVADGRKFIYGATSGCEKCINYNYTNIAPVNNQISISVRYLIQGDYKINVSIYNSFESGNASRIISVTTNPCAPPTLLMTYPTYQNSFSPQTEIRSNQIIISGIVSDIPCTMTTTNYKLWTAVLIDPNYLTTMKEIDLSSIPTANNSQLIIPPRFLSYGLYKFTLTVTMDKSITVFTFQSSNFTFLQIVKSPLVVGLSSGGLTIISRSIQEDICFTPLIYSQDPDLNVQDFLNWNWVWTCQEKNEIMNTSNIVYPKPRNYQYSFPKTGCFGDGPGIVNFTTSPCFAGNNLDIDKMYMFNLTARAPDNRTGSSLINVRVVNGTSPNITIQCSRPLMCNINKNGQYAFNEVLFNPSDSLILSATCVCLNVICEKGFWSILNQVASSWETFNQTIVNSYVKGFNSLQMSLIPDFFTAYSNLTRIQICYNSDGLPTNGFGCIQFAIYPLPKGVTCQLNTNIIPQAANLCVNCTFNSDYQYRMFINNTGSILTLGYTGTGYLCSIVPYQPFAQAYMVRVTNSNGGFTDVLAGNVTVTQMTSQDLNSTINNLLSGADKSLQLAIAKSNFQDMAQIYMKYISVLSVSNQNTLQNLFGTSNLSNIQPYLGGSGYLSQNVGPGVLVIDNLPADKRLLYEKDRDQKSSVINLMTSGLSSFVPGNIKSLYLASSVLSSFGDSSDCINRISQMQISNNLRNMAGYFQNLQGTATKEDILEIGKNLLQANFLSDTAANVQINDGILRDIQQSKDNYMDYDTNMYSKGKSYLAVSDPNQAGNSLVLETNANFQSKVASGIGSNAGQSINIIKRIMRSVMVVGDEPISFQTNNLHYVASKQVGSALKNKTFLAGRSVVQLPDICQSLNISPGNCSNPNNPISVEMIGTPNNIRSYLSNPNVDGLPIPSKSDYLTVNLYTGTNSSDISASPNDSQNFTIFVTRDPSFQIPDFNMSESDPQISPPKTIPGTGTLFSGPASFEQKLVVYTFTLSGTDQSIHFQMKSNFSINCTQYLVVGRLAQPPILGPNPDGTSDSINFTFWGMIPSDTKYCNMSPQNNEPDPFTFFVSNNLFKQSKFSALQSMPDYSKTLNTIYFGVRELTPPEWNSYTSNNRPPVPYTISAQINHTFRVRIFSSGCYFLSDDNKNSWGTNGCVVGPLTTPQKTQCICNHLTSFSSGWLVAPNAIDFNYIFSNFDFTKNVTLFATEIAIAVVFILLLVWARRQDIKDIEKVGLTPLASNDPKDMYLYEVIVDTSIRNNAGTTSNVYFILSGELNETDPTHLVDSKRKILKRGNVDRFLLAVPRSLGAMQFIRLWHDNSGKGTNASWYCNCLGIIDLQTKEKFNFLVNKWFAVEEDDGQIDRIIPVAGINELLYFQEMFSRKMKANLSEDHLWLSIIARPPESRFTRVERVACCLLLLFLTMLTTCMFYQTEGPSKPVSNILTIGPFALSAKELWTGFISNIIAFVPLFVLIELFRRSSLKHGYANLLREAVENHLQISLNSDKVKGYHSSTANLIWNEDLNISRPVSRSMGHINIQLNENDTEIDDMDVQEKETPVVRQKLFPWWMRIFAWTFLITLLIVASVLTTFYGIQFGDLACKKWISSMFISFFTSVLLVQPIKVICLAIFFALLCKDSSAFDVEYIGEEDEIMDELGRRNAIMQNEEYLHQELYTAPIKPHKICFRPPSQEEIEKARELRLKELQMYDVIREVGFYLAFFCTLLFISYSLRHPDAYDLQNELKNVFIKQAPDSSFTDITSETLFWNWILRVFVPRIRAPVWYNNDPPIFQRGFISNRNNRLIGYAIIRQVRSKKDSCKVNDYVKHLIKHCYSQYDIFNQDEKSYGFGWTELNTSDTSESPFLYSNESSLDGLPYIGRLSTYSGGGYVYKLKDDVNTLYNDLSALRDNKWIDFQTRAIFIEFTTFNPNINLFAIHTYVAEMPGNGGLWTIYRIEPANLLGLYSGGVKAFEIFCQVLYGIFILVIFVKEIRNFLKQKWKYFSQFWNFIELFIIFGSLLSAAGFAYVTIATNKLTGKFSQYGGSVYLNFAQVAFWNEYFSYLVSLIIFCATIKFIRVLRFNKRIGMLGAVLSYTATDMKQFFIIFFIMFLAFVMMFYSLFMDSLYRYHSFLFAIESSMNIPLGKFGFLELYQKAPIFGPIVFAGFVLFIVFVLLNMFVAILYNGFTVVKEDIDLQSSDHELMRFIFTKFVMWTGINDTKLGKKFIKTGITDQIYRDHVDSNEGFGKIDELQEKVEMILNCVNRLIYNDKRRNNINEKVFSSAIFNKSKPLIQDEFEANERIEKSRRILDVNKSGGLTPVYK
uniref:PKD1L-3 n=1 Tax=Schmidtea mediterranea TaxID=79327 RepID=A0A0H3YJK5_SCHMD|nr:PKD1L-3 [Schmidtea mediterranea]